mmetsp:Transcript_34936/g.82847  ORF Transcript_34936/g.82847 Transcript_34936/m.82847 type:complete len:408 (-) Transcript_34936:1142-2365(-)
MAHRGERQRRAEGGDHRPRGDERGHCLPRRHGVPEVRRDHGEEHRGGEEHEQAKGRALAKGMARGLRQRSKERVAGGPHREQDGAGAGRGNARVDPRPPRGLGADRVGGARAVEDQGQPRGRREQHDVDRLPRAGEQEHRQLGAADHLSEPGAPRRYPPGGAEPPRREGAHRARRRDAEGREDLPDLCDVPTGERHLGGTEEKSVRRQGRPAEPPRRTRQEEPRQQDGRRGVGEEQGAHPLHRPPLADPHVEEPEVVADKPKSRDAGAHQEEHVLPHGAGAVEERQPEGAHEGGRDDGKREPHGEAGDKAAQHEARRGHGVHGRGAEGAAEVEQDHGAVAVERHGHEHPVPGRVQEDVLAKRGKDDPLLHAGHGGPEGGESSAPPQGLPVLLPEREPPQPARGRQHR